MKRVKDYSMFYAVLAGFLMFILPICLLEGFIVWSNNTPSTLGVSLPEGTKIIEQTDTHKGLFRKKGVAVSVVQIPLESRYEFEQLLVEANFWDGPIGYDVSVEMEGMEEIATLLKAENILWTYRDEAIAFAEEPFSDYFIAVYDVETGICGCVEYDS